MRSCMLLNLRYLNCLAYRGRPNLLKGLLFSVATLGHMRTRLLFCSLPPSQCPFRHFDSPVLNLVSLSRSLRNDIRDKSCCLTDANDCNISHFNRPVCFSHGGRMVPQIRKVSLYSFILSLVFCIHFFPSA